MKYLGLGASWMLLALFPVTMCVAIERVNMNQPAVQLRDTVQVNGKQVWLSDLLPADAPLALQKTGAAIALCQSPQPGSARVLEAEQITSKLSARPELLRRLTIPWRVTVRYAGWPIGEDSVRVAVSRFLRARWKASLPDAAQLKWPEMLAVTEKDSALQVMAANWDNRQQAMQLRLRCSHRTSCGSFLVHIVLPAPLTEEWHTRLEPGSGLNSSGDGDSALMASGAALAEKGKPATLILDSSDMRISVRVICLQAGALNQEIRVLDARTRHVFHAEVVGAGMLHAAL